MKINRFLILIALAAIMSSTANATIWTVSNNTAKYGPMDFTSVQTAIDAAAAGDTLYVFGSSTTYGNATLTKPLVIIGSGFNHTAVDKSPIVNATTKLSRVYFNEGSEGSVIMSCAVDNVYPNTNNITVERNFSRIVSTASGVTNCTIMQNIIYNGITLGTSNSQIVIRNNILASLTANTSTNIILVNNYISSSASLSNSSIENNIFAHASSGVTGTNNGIFYNICAGSQFLNSDGNQPNVDIGTAITRSGSNLNIGTYYEMIPSGPADGMGRDGVDIGIFGGAIPYVTGGVSHLPRIYFFNASGIATGTNSLPVHLKAVKGGGN